MNVRSKKHDLRKSLLKSAVFTTFHDSAVTFHTKTDQDKQMASSLSFYYERLFVIGALAITREISNFKRANVLQLFALQNGDAAPKFENQTEFSILNTQN